MTDLAHLLKPEAVAVIGASDRPGNFGRIVVHNLLAGGFDGLIAPVHPRAEPVADHTAYPEIAALPDGIDSAIVCLGGGSVEAAVQEVIDRDIPSAVVFAEPNVGPGRDPGIEARVAALASEKGLAMLGMNGMGFYNLYDDIFVSGYDIPSLRRGGISLISHSGTVFDTITQSPRLAFNMAISGGNESVTTETDYLEFLLDDPNTTAIALYLETVRRPQRFMAALATAQARKIPVVALKVGQSAKGRAMAQAHTGALAGGPEAYASVFRRFGVHQVGDLEEMINTLHLLTTVEPVPNGGVGVVMDSGGERSLFVDICDELDVPLTDLAPETNEALREGLEEGREPANPIDPFASAHLITESFRASFEAIDRDPAVDVIVLAVDFQREADYPMQYLDALESTDLTSTLVAVLNVPEIASPAAVARLESSGAPTLWGMRSGLASLRHLIAPEPAAWRPLSVGRPPDPLIADWKQRISTADAPLDELASKRLLTAYGIAIPAGGRAVSVDEAVALGDELGYPVVAKTMAPGMTHKSDHDGVLLDLASADALADAYDRLADLHDHVLVERMTEFDHELILGVTHDEQFGPLVVLGMGGIYAEILGDTSACVAPMSPEEAADMARSLRGAPILAGARGRPAANLDSVIDVTLRIATLAHDFADVVGEIDVNPLAVREQTAIALDALIIPR